MKIERTVFAEQKPYTVVISDEKETLLAAQAAGRVIVGLALPGKKTDLWPAEYVYAPETGAQPCPETAWLERVVRRHAGLPWVIARTRRLCIRELEPDDFGQVKAGLRCGAGTAPENMPAWDAPDSPAERILGSEEPFLAYIRDQYRFHECGLWAAERVEDAVIVGVAGVSPLEETQRAGCPGGMETPCPVLELGYHIFQIYRRKGYAEEACRAILKWTEKEYDGQARVAARVNPENTASIRLIEKLGFSRTAEYGQLYLFEDLSGHQRKI